jgi:hypothetical protein
MMFNLEKKNRACLLQRQKALRDQIRLKKRGAQVPVWQKKSGTEVQLGLGKRIVWLEAA